MKWNKFGQDQIRLRRFSLFTTKANWEKKLLMVWTNNPPLSLRYQIFMRPPFLNTKWVSTLPPPSLCLSVFKQADDMPRKHEPSKFDCLQHCITYGFACSRLIIPDLFFLNNNYVCQDLCVCSQSQLRHYLTVNCKMKIFIWI